VHAFAEFDRFVDDRSRMDAGLAHGRGRREDLRQRVSCRGQR
jgi:hypothetical protein